jgi:uncharacterized protein
MIRLLCITDIHGAAESLQNILRKEANNDAVLLGGDLTNFGSPDDAEILIHLAKSNNPNVVAVAGNCDSAAVDSRLEELGVGIAGKGRLLLGELAVQGLSGAPLWQPKMYEFSEEEFALALQAGAHELEGDQVKSHPEKKSEGSGKTAEILRIAPSLQPAARNDIRHVVLSHVPPRGCSLDRTFLGKHVGSTALRSYIESRQPKLVVCGHIHEARGIELLGRTTVVNCGVAARGYYALVELDKEVRVALHRV